MMLVFDFILKVIAAIIGIYKAWSWYSNVKKDDIQNATHDMVIVIMVMISSYILN